MRNWSRFFALGGAERLFLLHCLFVVAMVRLGLSLKLHGPMRRWIAAMPASQPATLRDLRLVAWGVTAAARLVPAASCLTQAIGGQYLLARRGQASLVRIGVKRDAAAGLNAHAWLISGDQIILGGPVSAGFAHLVDFGR